MARQARDTHRQAVAGRLQGAVRMWLARNVLHRRALSAARAGLTRSNALTPSPIPYTPPPLSAARAGLQFGHDLACVRCDMYAGAYCHVQVTYASVSARVPLARVYALAHHMTAYVCATYIHSSIRACS